MELRHLRYFVTVAEERHFGRAAARLHMSQPPLSQQIKSLEKELGVLLLNRDRRGVSLTEAGAQLMDHARQVLSHAEQTQHVARQIREGSRGRVRIGFVGSGLYGIVPDLIRRLKRQEPEMTLVVGEIETGDQLDALVDGHLDLGIVRPPLEEPNLHSQDIAEEPLVLAVPRAHPFAAHRRVALSELADDDFVLFTRRLGVGYWDTVAQACGAAGFAPRVVYEAEHVHTMVGLVAAELGVSLVPAGVTQLGLPGVRYVQIQQPVPRVRLALAWNGDVGSLSPVVARARRVLTTPAKFGRLDGASELDYR